MRNHHLYAMYVSREFFFGRAPPTAFARDGAWSGLVSAGDQDRAREIQRVFTLSRSQVMPMRALQVLHRTHTASIPTSRRMGGDGWCATCLLHGRRCEETVEHRTITCPLNVLIHRAVWAEWKEFTGEDWADSLVAHPADVTPEFELGRQRRLARAIALGLRPDGARQHQELFALLRGLTLEAISSLRDEASASSATDVTPRAADLYHAATQAYLSIRDELHVCLQSDYERYQLLERRMRGAGLTIPPDGPVERWRQQWVEAGICSDPGANFRQHVLGGVPRMAWPRGISAARGAPRPDWAPPQTLPAGTTEVYIGLAETRHRAAWSVIGVANGDGLWSGGSHLAFEAAGPIRDADRRTPGHCLTQAVCEAARMLDRRGGTPALLRAPTTAAKTIAGTVADVQHYRRREWTEASRHRRLWLATAVAQTDNPWADRASDLANRCLRGRRHGEVDASLAAQVPAAELPDADQCCICFEDFTDVLPTADGHSRSLEGMFESPCRHSLCRECDRDVQGGPNPKCPLCRQPRKVWIQRRP